MTSTMCDDSPEQKRPNFSLVNNSATNGISRTSNVTQLKSGGTKKLVIKNFRGEHVVMII